MEISQKTVGLLNLFNELRQEARRDVLSVIKYPDNIISHVFITMANGADRDMASWVIKYKLNGREFVINKEIPTVEFDKQEKFLEKGIVLTQEVIDEIANNIKNAVINEWIGKQVL